MSGSAANVHHTVDMKFTSITRETCSGEIEERCA